METSKTSSLISRLYLYLIAIIALVTISTLLFIHHYKESRKTAYFDENTQTLNIAYNASIESHTILANYIFEEIINQDIVLNLFEKGITSQGDMRRMYKGLLYKELSPSYKKIQQLGIRQLHFQLSSNQSYLRFHKLEKYGDDLSRFRETVKIANQENRVVTGFETGRVISGFRNVFPLHYNGTHLGSVEISITTKSIIDALKKLDKRREYHFILKKDIVFSKLFESQKYLYKNSQINPLYVTEDHYSLLPNSPAELSNLAKLLNLKLNENKNVEKNMSEGKIFGVFVKLDDIYYDISFIPIKGVKNNIEGYLISYKKSDSVPIIFTFSSLIYTLIVLIALFISILVWKLRAGMLTIHYHKEWFKSINDSLEEGLYVVTPKAKITYINPFACKILGYTPQELLGKNAHYIFHSHYLNDNLPQKECPILKEVIENKKLIRRHEYFTCKNGKMLPVQINSRPIYKNGKLKQIVTAFTDISEKKELEEKTSLLIKALESSDNTVVITDLNAIVEWANPAFEKLTGYKIEDVVGKNPKDFVSSKKQSKKFYKDMWDTILSKKSWKGELINKRKNGSFYYEELMITPVLDEHGIIKHFIALKQDVSERKKIEASMQHFAFYDTLTNLPNRRLLHEHLGQIMTTLSRSKKYVAILFLDLDNFKILNDTHGHDIGDELLIQIAYRLRRAIRKEDIVSRLGGDEFIIVLSNLHDDLDAATLLTTTIAKKIQKTMKAPYNLKDIHYQSSTSIGISLFNDNSLSVDERLKNADLALYDAKSKGKNFICFFDKTR